MCKISYAMSITTVISYANAIWLSVIVGIFVADLPLMTSPHVSTSPTRQRPLARAGGFSVKEAECRLLSELWGEKASGTAADVGVTPQQEVAKRDTLTAVRSD